MLTRVQAARHFQWTNTLSGRGFDMVMVVEEVTDLVEGSGEDDAVVQQVLIDNHISKAIFSGQILPTVEFNCRHDVAVLE